MTDIVTASRRHMSGIVRRGMADKGENHTRPLRGKTGARSCCVAVIPQSDTRSLREDINIPKASSLLPLVLTSGTLRTE